MSSDGDHAAPTWASLSMAALDHFQRTKLMEILQIAVVLARRGVMETGPDDPEWPLCCWLLIAGLHRQTKYACDEAVLEAALEEWVAGCRLLLDKSTADHSQAGFIGALGQALFARYEHSGRITDLEKSVGMLRRAVNMADTTGDLFISEVGRVHLGIALVSLFNRTGDTAALDEALEIGHADTLATVRGDNADQVKLPLLFNPGDPRRSLIESPDDPDDPDHQKARATLVTVLTATLCGRYKQTGDLSDLDDALTLAEKALDLLPDADARHRMEVTAHLAYIYSRRYVRSLARADIDLAVKFAREVVSMLGPGEPDRTTALSNLATMLEMRFISTARRNVADIFFAHEAATEAVKSASDAAPQVRVQAQAKLASVILTWYEVLPGAIGPEAAVKLAREAVEGTPDGDPNAIENQRVLIRALHARYHRSKNVTDLPEAIALAKRVLRAEAGPVSDRLETVEECASWAAGEDAWEQATELYTACVNMMPRLVSPDRHPETRKYWLSKWAHLTHRAAASALNADDRQTAAVMLERGRGILMSHTFNIREEIPRLRAYDKDLADRFDELRSQLDGAPMLSTSPLPRLYTLDPSEATDQDFGLRRRRLLKQLDEVMDEIRRRPGFEQSLRPAELADLIEQAGPGPVVVPNISDYRSDALIISADGVHAVKLPKATPDAVRHAVNSTFAALRKSRTAWESEDQQAQMRAQREVRSMLAWLWKAITGPVLKELDITGPPAPGRPWPHIWWVPTGLLTLLPIHAAQHGNHSALDRVISSYTPTVRALRVARSRSPTQPKRRILAVAMPNTPDRPPLPFAVQEADTLARRFGNIVALSGHQATLERVRTEIPNYSWVHFACHAESVPSDPGTSRLLLMDHQSRPFTVTEIASLHLNTPDLAYLSACGTALVGDDLADEAMHLGSAFMVAGYANVIATLWPIRDDVGAELADSFYDRLDERDEPAAALHHACRHVRQKFGNFPSLWASHIHIGR